MDRRLIEKACDECRRFLEAAADLGRYGQIEERDDYRFKRSRWTGTLRRRRMDVIRAMEDLQHGGRRAKR